MSYQFEMHCHTAEVSYCASCTAEQSVALLKGDGYTTAPPYARIIYYSGWFDSQRGEAGRKKRING